VLGFWGRGYFRFFVGKMLSGSQDSAVALIRTICRIVPDFAFRESRFMLVAWISAMLCWNVMPSTSGFGSSTVKDSD
jgi:hypothetical protein